MSGKGRNTGIIIAIITALSVVVAAVIDVAFRGGTAPEAVGEITMPLAGASVSSPVFVMGTLKNIPQDHAVYVAVERGEMIWPQEPLISPLDRRWSVSIGLKGIEPGEPFQLALICVEPGAQQKITRWLALNNLKRDPMGLTRPEGIYRLDIVGQLTLVGKYRTAPPISRAADSTIVYRTKTGRKYHRANCPSLRKSKIKTTLAEARRRGLQPCKRCSPPV
jgi:hypothetical protein